MTNPAFVAQIGFVCKRWVLPERTVSRHRTAVIADPMYAKLETRKEREEYMEAYEFVKRGRKPLLDPCEEQYIMACVAERDRLGVGLTKGGVCDIIRRAVQEKRAPGSTDPQSTLPGSRTYVGRLLDRHPNLGLFKPSALDSHRAAAGSAKKLSKFHDQHKYWTGRLLQEMKTDVYGIPPERQWNMDEVRMFPLSLSLDYFSRPVLTLSVCHCPPC